MASCRETTVQTQSLPSVHLNPVMSSHRVFGLHTFRLLFVAQIAVDNGFGGMYGQQKAEWMVDVVQQYFHDNGK